jgi:uncharacterized protein YecT (DUF1311 family)
LIAAGWQVGIIVKYAVVAIAICSLVPFAAAAQFMKPGVLPEAGFAGVWRVIDAKPAPWADRANEAKGSPALLAFAVKFASGEVTGPDPLACKSAQFTSGVTSQDELFDGRSRALEDGAKRFHIGDSSVTTYRVICDGKTRDYYVSDNADLVTIAGAMIYTLQRPAGMDSQRVEAGFNGPSFDCAKAKKAGEQMICNDAALSKADRRLDAAYKRLKTSESADSFATVQRAQHDWLAYVTKSCGAGGAMPNDIGARNALNECLTDNYGDRAERLENAQIQKAGALVLEPRMRLLTRAKPSTEESDIYPWMMGGPEAGAFNAYIAKVLALGKRRMDDKDLFPFGDTVADMKLYARRTYSVARFDPHLASLQIATFDYTGGAHEAIAEASVNWDVARAKLFSLDDVFAKDKPWRKFVVDFCVDALHEDFAAQQAPDPDRSAIESVVGDGDNWLWGADAATVHFSVYTIASFSGGESDVQVPYDDLKPYLRPDAVVLAGSAGR